MSSRLNIGKGDATGSVRPAEDAKVYKIAYTPAEVAEMLGVNVATVYRKIKAGELRATKVGSRNYRILQRDLDAFLRSSGTS